MVSFKKKKKIKYVYCVTNVFLHEHVLILKLNEIIKIKKTLLAMLC